MYEKMLSLIIKNEQLSQLMRDIGQSVGLLRVPSVEDEVSFIKQNNKQEDVATKPLLNFVWVGPPQYDKGGHDVVGIESIDSNFKKFQEEQPNAIVFWCQKNYQAQYIDYFKNKEINVKVSTIEDCLESSSHDKAKLVYSIYNLLTSENRNAIVDRVCFKDLFSLFLMSSEGDYVLDTNILARKTAVSFPSFNQYYLPFITNSNAFEVWMQYSPTDDLSRANKSLDHYLSNFSLVMELFNEEGYSQKYHNLIGNLAVESVSLDTKDKIVFRKKELHPYIWPGKFDGFKVTLGGGLKKFYFNSHRPGKEFNYSPLFFLAYLGKYNGLKNAIEHGADIQAIANPKKDVVKTIRYDASGETLLHVAIRNSFECHKKPSAHLKCAELLLEKGIDINATYECSYYGTKHSQQPIIKKRSALTDVLYANNKEALILLLKFKPEVNNVLNDETPLMIAIQNNFIFGVQALLEHKADPNQSCAPQNNTPLTLALTNKKINKEIIEALLIAGANPNCSTKISEVNFITALEQGNSECVVLLQHYGAKMGKNIMNENTKSLTI